MQAHEYGVFPLHTVLFPGCKIALRIFEQRYLRMIRESTGEDLPFVVSLIQGNSSEVGQASECHQVGTLATVIDFNQSSDGVLDVVAKAGARVEILETHHEQDNLLRAKLDSFSEKEMFEMPAHYQFLNKILATISRDNPDFLSEKIDSLSATEVSFYLAHMAPVSMPKKQNLLELRDTKDRLAQLQAIFSEINTTFMA